MPPQNGQGIIMSLTPTPTEDLQIMADLVRGAEIVHSRFVACKKCCKKQKEEQEQLDAANATLRYVSDSLVYTHEHIADWRFGLSSELDKFARMLLEKGTSAAIARRTIFKALQCYRNHLTDRIGSDPNPYTDDQMERSNVSACLIELWDDGE
jgi:hypothetical protein